MGIIGEQAKKELRAGKRLWRMFLWLCVIFWGCIGLVLLANPAWPIGVVFVLGAGYVGYRLKGKKKDVVNQTPSDQ